MQFSEYVITESVPTTVDPLGFLRPSATINSGLFKQFTILTNHPAYQGFLAYAYLCLARQGEKAGSSNFGMAFRRLEILWGFLNTHATVSILNITKYAEIVGNDPTLGDARRYSPLFAKLGYGTLGHYSRPSISWGILDARGLALTPLGEKLGRAWSIRGKHQFGMLLDAWQGGAPLSEILNLPAAAGGFTLETLPELGEQEAWKQLISNYCDNFPRSAPLWQSPAPESVRELITEATYAQYHVALAKHYARYPAVTSALTLASQFELLAGLSQFIFESEYCRRLSTAKLFSPLSRSIEREVKMQLVARAKRYIATLGSTDTGGLFTQIANASDAEVAPIVLAHHARHQAGKHASSYIVGNEVAVRDRVDAIKFFDFVGRLNDAPNALDRMIRWRYRRDWHFWRAEKWLNYARRPA